MVRDDGDRGQDEDHRRHEERADGSDLDLARLDLLAEVLGRPPHHQAGDEDGDQDEEEHPVEAGADAAEDHLAGEHVHDRDGAAGRGERVVAAVDGAVRGVRRRDGPVRGRGDAVADLLVGQVPAARAVAGRDVHAGVAQHLRAVLLGGQCDRDADREHREHRAVDRPGLAPGVHHAAEHEHLRRRDEQDREHLEEVREAGRVLERHGRVRVVEPAAVRAELLDRDLRRSRSARDRLLAVLERRRGGGPVERLHDALRDEQHREDERERHQDVRERPVEIDPEVADRRRRAAREAADHRSEHGHPERGRDEVLHRQAGHLAQVRHRRLAAVVLPVRVRDEARGRVDRDVRRDRGQVVRVQRQAILQPQQQVEQHREERP